MENTNIELQRFSKKAASYRQALQTAPFSRTLEIAAIVSTLDGYIKSNELDKKALVVVDLMSGNGYLSNYLVQSGFKKTHAIEACNEMSANSQNYENALLHPIADINETNKVLKGIKPDIIVSLASFHHLIVRKSDNSIDYNRSIEFQSQLIKICVKNLNTNGILIIVDLFDDSLQNSIDVYNDNKYWTKNAFKKVLEQSCINQDIRNKINTANSLDSFSTNLKDLIPNLSNHKNPSLSWFRNIVDRKTTLGHDDVALSKELIDFISKEYNTTADIYYCPWVFENEKQLLNFLWYKFGFVNNESKLIKQSDVLPLAQKEVGINQYYNKEYYFGWALAMLTIRDKSSKNGSYSKRAYFALLILLIIILISYSIPKKYHYLQNDAIDKLIFLILGILIKSGYDLLSPYFWGRK